MTQTDTRIRIKENKIKAEYQAMSLAQLIGSYAEVNMSYYVKSERTGKADEMMLFEMDVILDNLEDRFQIDQFEIANMWDRQRSRNL